MKRLFFVVAAVIAILILAAAPAGAADNKKWFICKYVGTPGVDEVLQTGNNPISVSENAIGISPVIPGTFFNDSQGRSYVLVEDTGQPEPDPSNCPPPNTPPSEPPSAPPSTEPSSAPPSETPSESPSEAPSITPPPGVPTLFAVPCVDSGDVSEAQIIGDLLGLHVLIDGQPVVPDENGIVQLSPGVHDWQILTDDDTVVASGTITIPDCSPTASPTPPPSEPTTGGITPPPGTILPSTDTVGSTSNGGIIAILIAVIAVTIASFFVIPRRRI